MPLGGLDNIDLYGVPVSIVIPQTIFSVTMSVVSLATPLAKGELLLPSGLLSSSKLTLLESKYLTSAYS